MKFVIKHTVSSGSNSCKSRVGKISSLIHSPNTELQTPLLLLNTKGGSVMHLTHEVLMKVVKDVQCLQVPLSNSFKCYDGLKGFKKGIAEFAGLKGHLTYCTMHDPAIALLHGYNEKARISLWTCKGRMLVNADRFMDMMEVFKPDIYEALSDSDNDNNSTLKRVQKSADNSNVLLNKCIKRHNESEDLKDSALFGVIEGGYDMKMRERIATSLTSNPAVSGYVISGLHSNGPEVEHISLNSIMPVLVQTLNLLPEDKVRVVHGCWRPDVVVDMVEMGVDVFDSSLVDIVTERHSAFVFNWKTIPRLNRFSTKTNGILTSVNHRVEEIHEKPESPDYKLEICLKDKIYFDDFRPLVEGCTCLTCQKHTRAYIHHLHNTKELLQYVLLMIHNLHHYSTFFASIRESLNKGHSIKVI